MYCNVAIVMLLYYQYYQLFSFISSVILSVLGFIILALIPLDLLYTARFLQS